MEENTTSIYQTKVIWRDYNGKYKTNFLDSNTVLQTQKSIMGTSNHRFYCPSCKEMFLKKVHKKFLVTECDICKTESKRLRKSVVIPLKLVTEIEDTCFVNGYRFSEKEVR